MTEAIRESATAITIEYTDAVTAGDFALTDFTTSPHGYNPITITNNTPTQLRLFHNIQPIGNEASISYAGSVPGVLTPDSQPIIP